MARNSDTARTETALRILEAARREILESGFATLSTRKVADRADVPLSQIHYHFGSKEKMILAMLSKENRSLVERQSDMFARDIPLSERWAQACDYLDADLASGYVRVVQEMMAAGWSSDDVGAEMRLIFEAWEEVLLEVTEQAHDDGANFGPFTPHEIVALIVSMFIGAESMILLGRDGPEAPFRQALRRIGDAIKLIEPSAEQASKVQQS